MQGMRKFRRDLRDGPGRSARILSRLKSEQCEIVTDNEHFNSLLARSQSDLLMMISRTPYGIYPYAGVPWFSTPLAGTESSPHWRCSGSTRAIARGVLFYLARTQAEQNGPGKGRGTGENHP